MSVIRFDCAYYHLRSFAPRPPLGDFRRFHKEKLSRLFGFLLLIGLDRREIRCGGQDCKCLFIKRQLFLERLRVHVIFGCALIIRNGQFATYHFMLT
jgi:hypothetical protein